MRHSPSKTTGARAEFDEVWAVLQAMQEQDEVLDDIIHQMQAERRLTKGFRIDSQLGERGASAPWLKPSPQPIQNNQHRNQEPNGSRSPPTLTLDKLHRAIATRGLDRLARPWDEMLQLLVAYKKQHRHL